MTELLHVACTDPNTDAIYHSMCTGSEQWQQFGNVDNQVGAPGSLLAVCVAGVGNELHLLRRTSPGIGNYGATYHTIRYADGTWQKPYGDIDSTVGDPGGIPGFASIDCCGIGTDLHVASTTTSPGISPDTQIWHTIRDSTGSWQGWRNVNNQAGTPAPGQDLGGLAISGTSDGQLHVLMTTSDPNSGLGTIWYTRRSADGTSWTRFEDITNRSSGLSQVDAVACAGVGTDLHIAPIVLASGKIFHTIRHDDDTYQQSYGDVTATVGDAPGPARSVSVTELNGELNLMAVFQDPYPRLGLWHTVRHSDGSWQQPFFEIVDATYYGPSIAGVISS